MRGHAHACATRLARDTLRMPRRSGLFVCERGLCRSEHEQACQRLCSRARVATIAWQPLGMPIAATERARAALCAEHRSERGRAAREREGSHPNDRTRARGQSRCSLCVWESQAGSKASLRPAELSVEARVDSS
eukprot:6214360-Pleurochrysis_carterae.AAC.1